MERSSKNALDVAPTFKSPLLVLGATGLVGQVLVRQLRDAGNDVVGVSRHLQPPASGLSWVQGDLEARDLQIPRGVGLAFSISNIWLLPPALMALHSSGIKRVIAFSSTSRFTKEHSSVPAEREVARRLAASEADMQAFCDAHGMLWTILRPTVIYAEGRDKSITRIAALIKRFGAIPLSGDGSGKRQPVHADDLAAGAIAAATSPLTANRAYNLPGGETLSYRTMCERIFQGMGRRPRIVTVPPVLWRAGFALAGRFLPGASSAMGSRMGDDLVFDSAPAAHDFEWRPRAFHPRF